MTILPQTPAGRILLAIILSLAVHIAMLLAPLVEPPKNEPLLPPLIAKLEPLPKIAPEPAPAPRPKPKPKPKPAVPETPRPDAMAAPESRAEAPQTDPVPQPPIAEKITEEAAPAHPLPKRAELTFIVSKGNGFEIGESRHRLEIGDDRAYSLKVGSVTTGLAGFLKTFDLDQRSSGTLTAQGLRPSQFSEAKNSSGNKEAREARFDWQAKQVSFLDGHQTPLPEQAQVQDIISFLYQLSQLPLDKSVVPIYISNGKKLERYELGVGEEEEIETRLGKLRTLPLRKIHAQNEEGLDVWLGLEYRLLPVKIRHINRAGEIAGEMVISDIRVADE